MPTASPAAVLGLMLNALVWGVSWWPFRALQAQGWHPLWSTAATYFVALACMVAARPTALRGWFQQPLLWVLAAASGLTNVCFNWAVTVGDVVRVVLLFYLMPVWSVLVAWLVLGERPTPAALARVVLALAGVATVMYEPGGGFPWPRSLPDVLALLGGLSFALNNVLLLRLRATPVEARVLAMFGGAAVLAAVVASIGVAQGTVPALAVLPASGVLLALLLALCFLAGNLTLQYGAARLAAHTTALVMLSEVVFASLSSVALGAAQLTPRVLVGGLMILATAAWSAWPAREPAAAGAQ